MRPRTCTRVVSRRVMIDPLLSLSFNLHAQRGTYALLIGSGISRSANIPTGWEVTLDLIGKLAHLQRDACAGNEARWYAEKYGKDPDYSEILSAVAPTSAAQQQLLKAYFEPPEEEREEGKKLPTAAHKAVAQLVGSGHIRVIVTTNFDRLLEAALEVEGIPPVVIASPDAARGAPPLAHSKCTIIKVHGDYLDHRIKNSPEALSKYDKAVDRLLDQVFDEYGLIICGWSGEYDVALRKALERAKSRRYPMYWTGLSEPRGAAKDMIALHSVHFVSIAGADQFFTSVVEKVQALEEFDRPHPVSVQAAVATLKKYLSEERYRIQLRDFLVGEANEARPTIDAALAHVHGAEPNAHSTRELMQRLEAGCEKLVHLFVNGSFYAMPVQAKAFFDAFRLISLKTQSASRYAVWSDLGRYPALLLVYSSGIAAVASENYYVLREIASRSSGTARDTEDNVPAPIEIETHRIMECDRARTVFENRRHTPVSDYLFGRLRNALGTMSVDDAQYVEAFDNFEYLWCLLHVDAEMQRGSSDPWAPYGSFIWRWRRYGGNGGAHRFSDRASRAVEEGDKNWPPIRAGLFGGDLERLKAAKEYADQTLAAIGRGIR